MAFAGLWEGWRGPDGEIERTFAIATTDAGPDVVELHGPMPVILGPADWPVWLGETEGDPGVLLHPSPEGTLRTWPVGRRVGGPKNNDAGLIEPVEASAS